MSNAQTSIWVESSEKARQIMKDLFGVEPHPDWKDHFESRFKINMDMYYILYSQMWEIANFLEGEGVINNHAALRNK